MFGALMVVLLAVVAAAATAKGRTWSSTSDASGSSPRVLVLVVLAGAGLLWLVFIALAMRRAGGVTRLGFSPVWLLWAGATAAVFVTLGLVLHGWLAADPFTNHPGGRANVSGGVSVTGGTNHHPGKPKGQRGVPYAWTSTAAGLAVLLIGSTAVVARRRRQSVLPVEDDEEDVALSEWIVDSLDDLRRERDARRAVIAAYVRMERVMARVGLGREPSEAPVEFLERALLHLRAGAGSVRRLTGLFEEAKFSEHVVSERMRVEAIDALSRLQRELQATLANAIQRYEGSEIAESA